MQKKQKFIAAGIGAGAIGLTAALTGGTSAYLYDNEVQQATFQAGTIDLTTTATVTGNSLNPKANVTYDSVTKKLSASNLQPGDSFDYVIEYTNAGTLNGSPEFSWVVSNDNENGTVESETGNPDAAGELDDQMTVLYDIDAFARSANGTPQNIRELSTNPVFGATPFPLEPGKTRKARFTFTVPNSTTQGAENAIMTDSFDLTITVGMRQY